MTIQEFTEALDEIRPQMYGHHGIRATTDYQQSRAWLLLISGGVMKFSSERASRLLADLRTEIAANPWRSTMQDWKGDMEWTACQDQNR